MDMEVEELLYVLGNPTRRRILKLLSQEPKYLIQLSKELDVSQQAILKHITVLERFGLISSYEEKGELPAPPRKYYTLSKG
ncbi:MAG: transcriptional regulator, partial [Candidatus Hecatellales archaeon]